MSINVLIKEMESKIKQHEKMIDDYKKTIKGYGFEDCKVSSDFEFEKLKLGLELEDVKADILKAGSKYDPASVSALKNKEGRIITKINDINDILLLFDKINVLKIKISNLESKIKKIVGEVKPIDDERKQMNTVLKALRDNCSCEDAAKIANIKLKRIINWIHEGRNKTNKNKIYFYKYYSKIESNKKRKISRLLNHLKNGKTKYEACKLSNVSQNEFDIWYDNGRMGKDKINIDFYNNVNLIEKTGEKSWGDFFDDRHKSTHLNGSFKNAGLI